MIIQLVDGFNCGYGFSQFKDIGKDTFTKVLFQPGQFQTLTDAVIKTLNSMKSTYPSAMRGIEWCNKINRWYVYIPVLSLAALLNYDHYLSLAIPMRKLGLPIPSKAWSERTGQLLSFFADHISDFIRIAMLVTTVATLFFNPSLFGASHLAALVYGEIRNYVPESLDRFVRHALPLMTFGCSLSAGRELKKTALILGRDLFVNWIIARSSKTSKTRPEQQETTLESNTAMSRQEIDEILAASDEDYELNPEHYCKRIPYENILPQDREFSKLLEIYNEIPIADRIQFLRPSLYKDASFLDTLRREFPGEDVNESFYSMFERFAQSQHLTTDAYIDEWGREQLQKLVEQLQQKTPTDSTVEDFAIITAYLDSAEEEIRHQTILQIATTRHDCDSYEMIGLSHGIVAKAVFSLDLQNHPDDATKIYEIKIWQAIQNQRLFQIKASLDNLKESFPSIVAQLLNGADFFKGLYPIKTTNTEPMEFSSVYTAQMQGAAKADIAEAYRTNLWQGFDNASLAKCVPQFIQTDPTLSDADKKSLVQSYSDSDYWRSHETNQKFRRWVLVRLGILRKKEKEVPKEIARGS